MTNIIYSGDNQELLNKPLPYVYIGTRRNDGKIYIGARCANTTFYIKISDDLGKEYFTSSKNVEFEDFDWEILFIGKTKEEVFEFEGELIDTYLKSGLLVNLRGTKNWFRFGPHNKKTRTKVSIGLKKYFDKPGVRIQHGERQRIIQKKRFENPEARIKHSEGQKKRFEKQDEKDKHSERLRERWKNHEHRNKKIKTVLDLPVIVCPHCGKEYKYQKNLDKHLLIHQQ